MFSISSCSDLPTQYLVLLSIIMNNSLQLLDDHIYSLLGARTYTAFKMSKFVSKVTSYVALRQKLLTLLGAAKPERLDPADDAITGRQ